MFYAILGERGRRILVEAAGELNRHAAELGEQWQRQIRPSRALSVRAQHSIKRLFLEEALATLVRGDFEAYSEHVNYTARRLAKLRVALPQVTDGFLLFTRLVAPYLQSRFGERTDEILAAFDSFHHAVSLTVAHQYDEIQRGAVETLLGVLDAELESVSLDDLLDKLLTLAARAFQAKWGAILLLEDGAPDCGPLRHSALFGIDREMVFEDAPVGAFFRKVLCESRPGLLLDAADDPRIAQPYFRMLEIRSVWAVPLRSKGIAAGAAAGVLHVDFDRVYEFLPQELDLMTAFAERSSLAIERARLVDSVRASERRVRDLSRRLLRAQEEERGRISRDLHDETGQALLVIRLYLEMALKQLGNHAARAPVNDALNTADRTVDGLRRIIARLSPLVLDELGLAAALQRELRHFTRTHRVQARLAFNMSKDRLPREVETVVYRLVQEGLNNIAKHARAQHVAVHVGRRNGCVEVCVEDDGCGMPTGLAAMLASNGQTPSIPKPGGSARECFGLAGMKERLQLIGGNMSVESAVGSGTRLTMQLPVVN